MVFVDSMRANARGIQRLEERRVRQIALPPKTTAPAGSSLLETMIAVSLLAMVGVLVGSTCAYSLGSQKTARRQLEAARIAAQIMETLRSTSYDSLSLVENGGLAMEPLGKFHQAVLLDLEDRLIRDGLTASLTIRPVAGQAQTKYLCLTIHSKEIQPNISPEQVPNGKVLIKLPTYVTQRGLNP